MPPDGLSILFERTPDIVQYTNGSTVEAWSSLNFPGTPDPPAQVDNMVFRWFAPNGTQVAAATVDPDANGWALSTYRVTVVGTWAVNATYSGIPTLWTNRTFVVLSDVWAGTVPLAGSTIVGGNASLTIAPGTTVRLSIGAVLRVKGAVTAIGTAFSPIVLTSGAATPAPGDWGSVLFLRDSGNGSVLDHLEVRYARDGIQLTESAPRLANISVIDCLSSGFRITNATAGLFRVAVSRTANGIRTEGSAVTVENATVRDVSYGLLAVGGSLSVRNATIENATQAGVDARGTRIDLADVTLDGGGVGLNVTDTRGHGERLTFDFLRNGVEASGAATSVTLGNSTFGNTTLRHLVVTNGAQVAVLAGAFPGSTERVSLSGGSELTLWNFLQVRVRSYDTGANLSDAAVRVFNNERLVFEDASDANGTTPDLLVLYRRYAPALAAATVRISVSLAGYAFEDNNRTFAASASGTVLFRGSAFDLDADGEPDFSDLDVDGDGLDNVVEKAQRTDPRKPDTDGDGMPDGWEYDYQQNPRSSGDRDADLDHDGLTNIQEYGNGTDPRTPDTDEDAMSDGWEVRYRLNPLNASDRAEDADEDGFTNLEEYRGRTNPRDPQSFPRAGGFSTQWPFVLALVAALVIVGTWVVLRRRGRREGEGPPRTDGERK